MYQACDIMNLLQNLCLDGSAFRSRETVMKQFLKATKPFSAFEANVPKPFIVNEVSVDSELAGTKANRKAFIQGTTNVQAYLPQRNCARDRHHGFLDVRRGRAAHPAFPVLRRAADAICAAAGRRCPVRG